MAAGMGPFRATRAEVADSKEKLEVLAQYRAKETHVSFLEAYTANTREVLFAQGFYVVCYFAFNVVVVFAIYNELYILQLPVILLQFGIDSLMGLWGSTKLESLHSCPGPGSIAP